MSSVKGTPAYWKQFLHDVLLMVKQLRIPKYFLKLSCNDLRSEELPYIINKSNNLTLSDEELTNLSYYERRNLLNNNPVLVVRHLQFKIKVFFKAIILEVHLSKAKYYAICIEFQERGSPNLHSFIQIFKAPNNQNKDAYIEFIGTMINAKLPDHLNYPELFEIVKAYPVHAHSRTCWKYNKNGCRFSLG